jgi:hypothetical protein
MGVIFDRLMRRTLEYHSSDHGIAAHDFATIPLSPELEKDLCDALISGDAKDRALALFFFEGFVRFRGVRSLSEASISILEARLPAFADRDEDGVRGAAIPLLILLRNRISTYGHIMRAALEDSSSTVRLTALNAVSTFLAANEVEPLLRFHDDLYISEVRRMNGPLHYVLRNHALLTIEAMLGRTFTKCEKVETTDGHMIYWWDWDPFLTWYYSPRRKLTRRLRRLFRSEPHKPTEAR